MPTHKTKNGRAEPKYLCPKRGCEYEKKGFVRKDHFTRHLKSDFPCLKDEKFAEDLKTMVNEGDVDYQRRQRTTIQAQPPASYSPNPLYDVQQRLNGGNATSLAPSYTQTTRAPATPLSPQPINLLPRATRPSVFKKDAYSQSPARGRSRRGSST